MSGELRMVRAAAIWCGIAGAPLALVAGIVRGPDGAAGVGIALGMVLANTAVAGWLLAWASKRWPMMGPAVAMPSYFVRMAALLYAMTVLRRASFIDPPSFAIAFGISVVLALVAEARAYKTTPWAALTFLKSEKERP